MTVVGLPEGIGLMVANGAATLTGPYDAALYYRADFTEPGVLTPERTITKPRARLA